MRTRNIFLRWWGGFSRNPVLLKCLSHPKHCPCPTPLRYRGVLAWPRGEASDARPANCVSFLEAGKRIPIVAGVGFQEKPHLFGHVVITYFVGVERSSTVIDDPAPTLKPWVLGPHLLEALRGYQFPYRRIGLQGARHQAHPFLGQADTLRIHLQDPDVRARSIHSKSDPPNTGTEHLGRNDFDRVSLKNSGHISGEFLVSD